MHLKSKLLERFTFKDLHKMFSSMVGYKKCTGHLVYDSTIDTIHDGRHKAILVASDHPTDLPLDSAYYALLHEESTINCYIH